MAFGSGLIVSGLQRSKWELSGFGPDFHLFLSLVTWGEFLGKHSVMRSVCYAEYFLEVFLTRFLVSRKCLSI